MTRIIQKVLRIFLGLVFLYACWDKILHPDAFALVIYNYQILPAPLIHFTALVLPMLELMLAIGLLFGIWLPGVLLLSNLLLAVFFSALLFNAARGLDIHCGCFSAASDDGVPAATSQYILRDVAFLAVSLFLLLQHYREKRGAVA